MMLYPETIEDQLKREKSESEMINNHKKATKSQKLIPRSVKGDPNHTVFYCTTEEKLNKAINNFELEHKKYWL